MTVTYRPAVRENAKILLGIAGPSGAGKTLSALRIARGLAGGKDKDIFGLDTEGGKMQHYACAAGEKSGPFKFDFQHAEMKPPFSPQAYIEGIQSAVDGKAKVVIVDSVSHEHEGEGGVLEMQAVEFKKMGGGDNIKFASWQEPKHQHNLFLNFVLRANIHIIFCFRAKDKLAFVKKDGKLVPVPIGWQPICSGRFEYEMHGMLLLPPRADGIPDYTAEPCKIQEPHRPFFVHGKPLDESVGEQLAKWGGGKVVKDSAKVDNTPSTNSESPGPQPESPDFIIKSARKTTTFGSAAEWETNWLTAISKATPEKVAQGADLNAEIFENLTESGYLDEVEAVKTAIKAKTAQEAEK